GFAHDDEAAGVEGLLDLGVAPAVVLAALVSVGPRALLPAVALAAVEHDGHRLPGEFLLEVLIELDIVPRYDKRVPQTQSLLRRDVADQAQRPALVAALLVELGQLERALGDDARPLDLAGGEQALAEMRRPQRETGAHAQPLGERDAVLEEAQPLVHPTEEDAGQPEE